MRWKTGMFVLLCACPAVGWTCPTLAGEGAAKREHWAVASDIDTLDGPLLESLGSGNGGLPTTDGEGNLYLVHKYSTARIRCFRADGTVETIAGDDRWPGNADLEEGPAAYFPNCFGAPQAGGYSIPGALLTVRGLPLKGEEQGCIYFRWPGESPYRIYKNKEKAGRWWFKRLGAPGKAKPPTTAGQTAKVSETDLTDAMVGNRCIVWEGNVYDFDEAKGEITCTLALAEYGPKLYALYDEWAAKYVGPERRPNRKLGPFEHTTRADDGAVYLTTYWYGPPNGVFRISPDRTKFEFIVADMSGVLKGTGVGPNRDGPGLTTTWHCGPADVSTSGSVVFLHAIDSVAVRRWMDGRVSALCYDGEWRETPKTREQGGGVVKGKHHQPGQPGAPYIYITYPGEENGGDIRFYRFGPVDFAKPTVGPLQEVDPNEGVKK